MIVHRMVAYDLQTEHMVVDLPLKASTVLRIKSMANVPAEDPSAIGSYPLEPAMVRELAEEVGIDPDAAERFDWFMQAFEAEGELA